MDLINFMVNNPNSDYLDYLGYCDDYWKNFEKQNNMNPTISNPGLSIDKWINENCLTYRKWLENGMGK